MEPVVVQRPDSGAFAASVVDEQDVADWPMACVPGKPPLLLYERHLTTWLSCVGSSSAVVTPRIGFPWRSGRI